MNTKAIATLVANELHIKTGLTMEITKGGFDNVKEAYVVNIYVRDFMVGRFDVVRLSSKSGIIGEMREGAARGTKALEGLSGLIDELRYLESLFTITGDV